ncbi:MAG: hypothetical protein R3A11_07125 [Bdellovibrionota bacterium]
MKISSEQLTNLLLFGIFLLLAVDVFSPKGATVPMTSSPSQTPHRDLSHMGTAPKVDQPTAPTANPHAGGFDFQSMVLAALKCPSDPVLTLSDVGCSGQEAQERKQAVRDMASENLPPRALFDRVIARFGEEALTDQAQEIRRANRG